MFCNLYKQEYMWLLCLYKLCISQRKQTGKGFNNGFNFVQFYLSMHDSSYAII